MRPLILAPLTSDLIPAAVALDQCCLGGMWGPEHYHQELTNPISTVLACLTPKTTPEAELRESLLLGLGCSWAIAGETHITLLAVNEIVRGQGLGALMLWALLKQGLHNNQAWATLEVAADNQPALKLYQKMGFQEAGRRPKYYSSGADAIILWLKSSEQNLTLTNIEAKLAQAHWQLIISPNLSYLKE